MQVLCLAGGLERFSLPVLSSVTAISVGTGLTAFLVGISYRSQWVL